jgi:hypothetical protein
MEVELELEVLLDRGVDGGALREECGTGGGVTVDNGRHEEPVDVVGTECDCLGVEDVRASGVDVA